MLIKFKISNFLSFFNEEEFSLVPGRTTKHKNHIIKTKSTTTNILKSSVFYGANSSGKSNLLKAIKFAQNFIVEGPKLKNNIYIPTFKLIEKKDNESKFIFEILVKDSTYEYGFKILNSIVSEEWLYKTYRYPEHLMKIFERSQSKNNKSPRVEQLTKFKNSKVKLVFESTSLELKSNQLFLTAINNKNQENIDDIYKDIFNWFESRLLVIFPDSKVRGIQLNIKYNKKLKDFFDKYLREFDTGIDGLKFHQYSFEDDEINIPKEIKERILNELDGEIKLIAAGNDKNEKFLFERNKKGEILAFKLKTMHKMFSSDREIEFDFSEESDGTNRIFDLIPLIQNFIETERVVLIDEIDRSWNSLIADRFFSEFFSKTNKKKSQLIATTHDLSLLDLNKFRRDEIWFVKKNTHLESELYSLEEFKERFDKQLRTAYLKGRYGAIPILEECYEEH